MKLSRHALSALALSLAFPLVPPLASAVADAAGLTGVATNLSNVGAALAGPWRPKGILIISMTHGIYVPRDTSRGMTVVVPETDTIVSTVRAEVSSDAGSEDLTLTESNAWLHGAATIEALPTTDASLTLSLYDTASASLISFSGTLAADGTVTLAADTSATTHSTTDTTTDCTTRIGCTTDTTTTTTDTTRDDTVLPDIELLAAELYPSASGYELALDLAGVDTYAIAYADITVTESFRSDDPCLADRSSTTVCGDTTHLRVTTGEVDWDAVGAVWEAELAVQPEGLLDVNATAYDSAGARLDTTKATLGDPWLDEGEGINVVGTDEDPLTTMGILPPRCGTFDTVEFGCAEVPRRGARTLTVASGGWTVEDALPTHVELELDNGDTLTIPANSYQRRMRRRPELLTAEWDALIDDNLATLSDNPLMHIVIDGSVLTVNGGDLTFSDLSSPVCAGGTCVMLIEDTPGDYELAVTAYGTDAEADAIALEVGLLDARGAELLYDSADITFDDEVTVVFANEVTFSENPDGLDLSGKLSLLGAADTRGRQNTLAKGKFHGTFTSDGDGELSLAGLDKNEVSARGDIVIAGAAVSLTDADGNDTPPPLASVSANGKGTKNSASKTSAKPQLL